MYETVEDFRDAVQAHFPLKNVIYQPILHPLFEGWTTSRPCPETLELILNSCGNMRGKGVLDLGCALGYYSHRLAERGAVVDGVELKTPRYEFCQYLSKLYGLSNSNPMFYNMDLVDYVNQELKDEIKHYEKGYHIVLFLNTIHWVFRKHGNKTWDTLDTISTHCDKMYFSRGGKTFTPEKIIDRTHFSSVKDLGFPNKKGRGRRRRIFVYE
jgi:hypothetical protein